MILGSVNDSDIVEKRIPISPDTIKKYIASGFSVQVEKDFGKNSNIQDVELQNLGAKVLNKEEIYKTSDILIKINCPSDSEISLIKDGAVLIGSFFPHLNKDKINKYKNEWKLNKIKNNPTYKMKDNLRHRIYMALKGTVKSKRTIDLLGTSIDNLWNHLEKSFRPGMTKNNYGRVWHVDHKIPCAAFDLTKPKEQSKCFHFTNLQALFVKENLSKGAKLEWQN